MYKNYNPNPFGSRVGDCAVRAVCKAMDLEWSDAYLNICIEGLMKADMPSSNAVWGSYLCKNGFKKEVTDPNTSLKAFAAKHPKGTFVVALNGHVVTVKNGNIYDTWDSSEEIVLYYWRKEE